MGQAITLALDNSLAESFPEQATYFTLSAIPQLSDVPSTGQIWGTKILSWFTLTKFSLYKVHPKTFPDPPILMEMVELTRKLIIVLTKDTSRISGCSPGHFCHRKETDTERVWGQRF